MRRRLLPLCLPVLLACCAAGLAAPRPGPFRFCYGLQHPADLPVITELGLNTLYLELAPGDAFRMEEVRALIGRAREQGLQVIVALPTCLAASYHVRPGDEKYCGTVREVIGRIVRELKDDPGVTAWATASHLERRLEFDDEDFRAYLQRGYPTLEHLNAHWVSRFPTWPSVTMAAARALNADAPYKLGPAAIDVADYQVDAFRQVMALWLAAIREVDPQRPVLTGRVTLYRSLLSIPRGYDVVCVSMPPDILEPDLQAHNPHALDIARRGGQFHVLPTFRVPNNLSPAYGSGAVRDWAQHAALHGAVGYGLEDWEMLAVTYHLERGRAQEKARLLINALAEASAVPFDLTPQATALILYSPYASGFEVTRQPVYGYLLDVLPGEPSNLLFALRLGTRYGLADVLSVADLPAHDLSGYGCILAPACYNLPAPQAGQLAEYVRQGGVLVADLGLGAYQTRSWVQLPESLQPVFGVAQMGDLKERLGDLTAADGLEQLQPWPRGMRAVGTFNPSRSDTGPANERRGYPVSGWVGEVLLQDAGRPLATLSARFDEDKRPLFSGLIGHPHGTGLGLFATHPLWQYWPLSDGLSEVLHGHLLARRARHELAQGGLLQAGLYFATGGDRLGMYNGTAEVMLAQMVVQDAGNRAYLGAACQFMATPAAQGLQPGTALVAARAPGRQCLRLVKSALTVQPYAGDVTVALREVTPARVQFDIAGSGSTVAQLRDGLILRPGEPVSVRLVLGDGGYPIRPNSRHTVVSRTRNKDVRVVLTANERGELDLSDTYFSSTLTITSGP